MSKTGSWRGILIGAGAVLIGHVLVVVTARVIDGEDPVISYYILSLLFLGVIQLVYVVPIVVYGIWRNSGLAVGAGSVGVMTLLGSAVGLLH